MCGVAFLAVLWMRSNYGGSCNALRLRMCQSVKIRGSLALNARFEVCLCILACLWMRRHYGGSCNACSLCFVALLFSCLLFLRCQALAALTCLHMSRSILAGKKKDLRYGILRDRSFFCHDRDLHSGSLVSLVFLVLGFNAI